MVVYKDGRIIDSARFCCTPKQSKDILPNGCEYSSSQPDCVIYHINSVQKQKVAAVTIQTDSSESDSNSDVNVEDVDGVKLAKSMGCTIEVK